jgi:hypothetical protein
LAADFFFVCPPSFAFDFGTFGISPEFRTGQAAAARIAGSPSRARAMAANRLR